MVPTYANKRQQKTNNHVNGKYICWSTKANVKRCSVGFVMGMVKFNIDFKYVFQRSVQQRAPYLIVWLCRSDGFEMIRWTLVLVRVTTAGPT